MTTVKQLNNPVPPTGLRLLYCWTMLGSKAGPMPILTRGWGVLPVLGAVGLEGTG